MSARGALGRVVASVAGAIVLMLVWAPAALAQLTPDPNVTPTKNNGGPFIYGLAVGAAVLGVIVAILVVVGYMRFAPRFQREHGKGAGAKADRVALGQELPRRAVDVSQAQPVVVAPPAVPVGVAAAAPATAPAPAAAAPAATAPAPAAEASAPAPPAAAPAEERPEVSLDEEVFEATLAELLEQGVDRRVAEGKARRAAMIAARKKAEGS
ncbi:MAG: hypothetical protein WEA10_00645 [Actinomycetota bacterium]